jgi:hypothetical protein
MSDESAESRREYKAMMDLDDVIGTLIECGWTDNDLRERVDTILEDSKDD